MYWPIRKNKYDNTYEFVWKNKFGWNSRTIWGWWRF